MSLKDRAAPYIRKHEGVVQHMYLDKKGYVTVGVGYYLATAADTVGLPFRFKKAPQDQASDAQKKAEWQKLYDLKLKNHKPAYFAGKTTLELGLPQVEWLFLTRTLEQKISLDGLRKTYDNFVPKEGTVAFKTFDLLPESAQIALWDMAYCLGMGGLRKFKKLLTACKQGDWETAAVQSKIAGGSNTRNNDNKEKFDAAADEVAAANRRPLPSDPLCVVRR